MKKKSHPKFLFLINSYWTFLSSLFSISKQFFTSNWIFHTQFKKEKCWNCCVIAFEKHFSFKEKMSKHFWICLIINKQMCWITLQSFPSTSHKSMFAFLIFESRLVYKSMFLLWIRCRKLLFVIRYGIDGKVGMSFLITFPSFSPLLSRTFNVAARVIRQFFSVFLFSLLFSSWIESIFLYDDDEEMKLFSLLYLNFSFNHEKRFDSLKVKTHCVYRFFFCESLDPKEVWKSFWYTDKVRRKRKR